MIVKTMRISEVIRPDTVDLFLDGCESKDTLIRRMVNMLYRAGMIQSECEFLEAVEERERMGPTFMENNIAIPHGKSDTVIQAGVAFVRSMAGIEYQTALGGGTAKLIFLLAIPNSMSPNEYVGVLANLARLLIHEEFREALLQAASYEDVIRAIVEGEALLED